MNPDFQTKLVDFLYAADYTVDGIFDTMKLLSKDYYIVSESTTIELIKIFMDMQRSKQGIPSEEIPNVLRYHRRQHELGVVSEVVVSPVGRVVIRFMQLSAMDFSDFHKSNNASIIYLTRPCRWSLRITTHTRKSYVHELYKHIGDGQIPEDAYNDLASNRSQEYNDLHLAALDAILACSEPELIVPSAEAIRLFDQIKPLPDLNPDEANLLSEADNFVRNELLVFLKSI